VDAVQDKAIIRASGETFFLVAVLAGAFYKIAHLKIESVSVYHHGIYGKAPKC
jgi:hypothetical protein